MWSLGAHSLTAPYPHDKLNPTLNRSHYRFVMDRASSKERLRDEDIFSSSHQAPSTAHCNTGVHASKRMYPATMLWKSVLSAE
jgi:hypothetical protein